MFFIMCIPHIINIHIFILHIYTIYYVLFGSEMTSFSCAKSLEIETAVDDLLAIVAGFPLEKHIPVRKTNI